MFSFKATIRNSATSTEYVLEHPVDGEWKLSRNGQEIHLTRDPQMYRDGGTIEAEFDDHDGASEERRPPTSVREEAEDGTWTFRATFPLTNKISIPQQLFPVANPPAPTVNGEQFELIEWWIGGQQHLNGAVIKA